MSDLEKKLDAKESVVESRMDDIFNKKNLKLDLNTGGNSTFRSNYRSGKGNGGPLRVTEDNKRIQVKGLQGVMSQKINRLC